MLTNWPRASIVRGTQVTLPHGRARGRTTRLGGGPRRIVNARGVKSAKQVGRVRYDSTPGRACRRTQAPHDSPVIRVCEYGSEIFGIPFLPSRRARQVFARDGRARIQFACCSASQSGNGHILPPTYPQRDRRDRPQVGALLGVRRALNEGIGACLPSLDFICSTSFRCAAPCATRDISGQSASRCIE